MKVTISGTAGLAGFHVSQVVQSPLEKPDGWD